MSKTKTKKQQAVALLHKYDTLRAQLRDVEQELNRACLDYGREQGYFMGFSRDKLRVQLLIEAERAAKERKATTCAA